uniref:Uncharacterized protein n=1 Tax=Timema cristinae TaxID=61476 RepID=A0A7R9CV90_TIMCR|nr:unnamed protein product [Timema cristinae]
METGSDGSWEHQLLTIISTFVSVQEVSGGDHLLIVLLLTPSGEMKPSRKSLFRVILTVFPLTHVTQGGSRDVVEINSRERVLSAVTSHVQNDALLVARNDSLGGKTNKLNKLDNIRAGAALESVAREISSSDHSSSAKITWALIAFSHERKLHTVGSSVSYAWQTCPCHSTGHKLPSRRSGIPPVGQKN